MHGRWLTWCSMAAPQALAFLGLCLAPQTASAQIPGSYGGEVSQVDAYGNASPVYSERRRIRAFANDAQRRSLRSFQEQSRRASQRGGLAPFALPGGLPPVGRPPRFQYPHAGANVSEDVRSLYRQYGGFEQRATGAQMGDVGKAFTRRNDLIEATSLNSPVHRARATHGVVGIGLAGAVRDSALRQADTPPVAADAVGLDDWLSQTLTQSYSRARAEGWSWFRKGREENSNFRRAARAFESAVILDPLDFESRIGALFSHLSLGGFHTAMALLGELTRRDANLFAHAVDLAELYGDPIYARQVRLSCESYAQAGGGKALPRALQVFVTWYIGERERAIAEAETLQKVSSETGFAGWVAQMRSVQAGAPGRVQP